MKQSCSKFLVEASKAILEKVKKGKKLSVEEIMLLYLDITHREIGQLRGEMKELRGEINDKFKEVNERINEMDKRLTARIDETNKRIDEISQRLSTRIDGGFRTGRSL